MKYNSKYRKVKFTKRYKNKKSQIISFSYFVYIRFIFAVKFIILICSLLILTINTSIAKTIILSDNYNIYCHKWIVMTAFNPPTNSIIELEKKIKDWKIVVIGTIITNNESWNIFEKSNNLIYLSIESQNKLGYEILKYIPEDSYCRKNIGYLFAIQNGAKEIYEIDENLNFNINNLELDYIINSTNINYANNNEGKMINPYVFFGESNIWPRGFLLKDVIHDYNNSFYHIYYNQIKLKPLLYQGLINKIPDIDPIFINTNIKLSGNLDINFTSNIL